VTMTLPEMHRDLVHISDGRVINKTTMSEIVQADHPNLNEWRRSFKRSYVDCTAWAPGKPQFFQLHGRTTLNIYRPPAMLEAPSNWMAYAIIFEKHIDWLVPVEQRRTFKMRLGHMVQKPWERPATAIVFKGRDATGFNALAQMIANALPDHSCLNTTEDDYNGRLAGRLFATSINARDTSTREPFYRRAVLEDHRKYGRHHHEANCTRFTFFQSGALPFKTLGREFIEIDPAPAAHPDYYLGLHAIMGKPEFVASVQRYLLSVDISTFEPDALAPLPLPVPKPKKPRKPRTEGQNTWAFGGAFKPGKRTGAAGMGAAPPLPGDPMGDPVAPDPG
jgi:hypothetical protein